jgi:inorganic pyrophosphatase
MPSAITRLEPFDADGNALAVIEGARGTRSKFKFDPDRELFIHDKSLPRGLAYPLDFGFIPGTRAEDGDPIDILVLMDEPAFPGAIVPARVVGALEAEQIDEESPAPVRNDRIVAVACKSVDFGRIADLDDLPDGLMDSIEAFFVTTGALRGRTFRPLRRVRARTAKQLIRAASSG